MRYHPLLLLSLLAFFSLASSAEAQGGKAGLSFLKLGVGGRAVAMGEAHATLATDATATYFNPAGLASIGKTDVMAMHKEWFEGVQTEFLAIRVPIRGIAVGLSVNTTNIKDIQLRTRPGPPEGTFSSHDFSLGVSLASRIHSSLDAGITMKYLYEKIFVDETSGGALDLGLRYETGIEGLIVGVMASNFGWMARFREEEIKLPSLLRLGSSYSKDIETLHSTLVLAADVVKVFQEEKTHLHTGAEVTFEEMISFRGGYLFGYETRNLTLGLGLRKDFFRVDYGFSPQSQNLNSGHTISVGVEF